MNLPEQHVRPLTQLLLALADDKLVMGHRNSDWTGLGPILEEDIAFSHLAQDDIAHAQAIYQFLAPIANRTADQLAFDRAPGEFRCASIVELPDEFDFAFAIARQCFVSTFNRIRLERLSHSNVKHLAALAKRIAAEEQLHVDHTMSWMNHLARGTAESNAKLQSALHRLAPHAPMLWEQTEGQQTLCDAGVDPGCGPELFNDWRDSLQRAAREAGLNLELNVPDPNARGGRRGTHTPHLKELLDEMCEVWRLEPDAAW